MSSANGGDGRYPVEVKLVHAGRCSIELKFLPPSGVRFPRYQLEMQRASSGPRMV